MTALEQQLADTRASLDGLERRSPRRSARLRLDFLDARTEFTALRITEADLLAALERIRAEADAGVEAA